MKSKVRSSFSWFLSILLVLTMMPAMALTAYAADFSVSIPETGSTTYGTAGTITATPANAAGEVTYTWYQTDEDTATEDSVVASNDTTGSYTVPGTTTPDTYYYYCVANDTDANATSGLITFVVAPKVAELTWSATGPFTYNGSDQGPTLTATLTNAEVGDVVEASIGSYTLGTTETTTDEHAAAGDYVAHAALSGNDAGKYTLVGSNSATQQFTINPLQVTLAWSGLDAADLVYDGTPKEPTAEVDNAVGEDVVGVTVTYTEDHTNAGEKVATVSTTLTGADKDNYTTTGATLTQNYTIAPMVANLGWSGTDDNGTAVLEWTGEEQLPEATVTNAIEGDEVTVTVTGDKLTYVGDTVRTATASGFDGADKNNYTLPASYTKDFKIGKRNITFKANPQSVTVGGSIDPADFTVDGLRKDSQGNEIDKVTGVTVVVSDPALLNTEGSHPGAIGFVFSSAPEMNIVTGTTTLESVKENYNITLVPGDLTVTAATTPSTSGGGRTSGGDGGGLPATTPTTTPTETPATTPTEVVNPTPTTTPTDSSKATVAGFNDVTADKYYAEPVRWAVSAGITNGTSATEFEPNASCTRGQMVTFMWRAEGCPEPAATTTGFTDVKSDAYYAKAVQWAVGRGITNGLTATSFGPDETVDRGQTVTFLYRANGGSLGTTSSGFADVDPGAYYAEAVGWAAANGITTGTTASTFSPSDDCNRAQIVTFLYRANN